jgi:hypothetical protein
LDYRREIMRYIKVYGEAAYCGTSFEEYLETDMTDKELDEYVSDKVAENAESYDYMVFGWDTSMEEYVEENDITMELALKKHFDRERTDTYVSIGTFSVNEVRKILLQNEFYGQIYETTFLNNYSE